MTCYFITGTDTDVGKTVVTTALLRYFNGQGLTTIGFKPISAGCERTAQGLRNADALSLQQHSSLCLPYDLINPYAYEPPIAPHIAAQWVGDTITLTGLSEAFALIKAYQADITLVEGAGGWCLPINQDQFLYQWVAQEQLAVIVVVGIKLGCLNHAFLTEAFILSQGLTIVGWVANCLTPHSPVVEQNITTLKRQLKAPLLARIDFLPPAALADVVVDFVF